MRYLFILIPSVVSFLLLFKFCTSADVYYAVDYFYTSFTVLVFPSFFFFFILLPLVLRPFLFRFFQVYVTHWYLTVSSGCLL